MEVAMIFKQFRDGEGCLSYLIGCEKNKVAAVIDPSTNTHQYLESFKGNDLNLRYAIDSHTHADHISGAGTLAKKMGAKVIMSKETQHQRSIGGQKAPENIKEILKKNTEISVDQFVDEKEIIKVGEIPVGILHTPGHTIDTICLLLPDRILTADILHIGQAGRTDLPGGSSEEMYETLFKKILPLSDDLLVYPGHDYNENINSSLGYEKKNNEFLKPRSKDAFVQFVARFFPEIKPGMQCGVKTIVGSGEGKQPTLQSGLGDLIIDYMQRHPEEYTTTIDQLKKRVDAKDKSLYLLDVRTPAEVAEGYIKGAVNIPIDELPKKAEEIPREKEVVAYCRSGVRSALATMYLRARGFKVNTLDHGIHEWEEAGYPIEK
jgi:glyoxylase-like metal-dependent hydrolase (beta-lactamase superfamily II)/rhodanese-related sulfurtransferase